MSIVAACVMAVACAHAAADERSTPVREATAPHAQAAAPDPGAPRSRTVPTRSLQRVAAPSSTTSLAASVADANVPPPVAKLLRASGLPLSSFGIDVRPIAETPAPDLLSLNADQPFLLASTTKLVTSLAALDLLGPDHRWSTRAHATGPVMDGRLNGDLVIVGGEVGLTAAELRRWFTQMRTEGVREVAGNIVLDDVALLHDRDPAQAAATAAEASTDRRPEDALPDGARAYNLGKLLVSVEPGPGERATVGLRPRPANVVIVNDVLMGGGCEVWARWRTPQETGGGPVLQLWVRGRWDASCGHGDIAWIRPPGAAPGGPRLLVSGASEPVPPDRLVADLWRETGGRLRGRVVANAAAPGPGPSAWRSSISTPLAEVMREMNKTSNNAAAKSLLRALAGGMNVPRRTLESAQQRVQEWLRAQGLADGDIRVVEGSGQSHGERGKPRALVQLLVNAWRGTASQAFLDSLPIAGVDGTLAHRLKGPATGQAWLKTGTLSGARSLAGYVRGRSGTVYAVSAIVMGPAAAKGTPTLDALIEWLAREG
jgi:D-alanyl-D-alanine carboxypeptidase/D-alanyl-D-alanine-endopeptidase (penicillin-binding protein 4)